MHEFWFISAKSEYRYSTFLSRVYGKYDSVHVHTTFATPERASILSHFLHGLDDTGVPSALILATYTCDPDACVPAAIIAPNSA